MKWQGIHQIIDEMSSQTSVKSLDGCGVDSMKLLLSKVPYRLYYNCHIRQSNVLEAICINEAYKIPDSEFKLIKELGSQKCFHPAYFVEDNYHYFVVTVESCCRILIVLDGVEDTDSTKNMIQVVKTVCAVWQNQLGLLYLFQRDALTSLYNANLFTEAVNGHSFDAEKIALPSSLLHQSQSERRQRNASSDCVALINIDDFKTINERFGHTIGDEVLMKMARLMEHCFREDDLLCRYSGDEFAVLLRHVSAQDAVDILTRFEETVEQSHFPRIDNVSTSVGFTMSINGMLTSELIERSKMAIKHAKEHGKKQVVGAESFMPSKGDGSGDLEVGEIELF